MSCDRDAKMFLVSVKTHLIKCPIQFLSIAKFHDKILVNCFIEIIGSVWYWEKLMSHRTKWLVMMFSIRDDYIPIHTFAFCKTFYDKQLFINNVSNEPYYKEYLYLPLKLSNCINHHLGRYSFLRFGPDTKLSNLRY